jgi:MFS family permease
VKIVRAGWTSASFLLYAGALVALFAAFAWQGVISGEHSQGAFAGWTVLFYAVAEAVALIMLARGRRLIAGLFAFVAVGLFGVMVSAFFNWFGWLSDDDAFHGFHWGNLGVELLILVAAVIALRIFRFPLLVLLVAGVGWFFVTDLVSSGGNWSATVTLLFGIALFFRGLGLDGGDSRWYGFWVHVVAGLTIGGALLYWLHSSDGEWAGILIFGLLYILMGSALRRSSYAVLGVIGMVLATGHYSFDATFSFGNVFEPPTTWAAPVAYLCLGLFLVLVGMVLHRRNATADPV